MQYLINQLINLDPYLAEYLQPLAQKTISITCDEYPNKVLYCIFNIDHIELTTTFTGDIDLAIHATLTGLLMLATQKQKADLRAAKIVFSGDGSVAQNLQNLLFKLEIDWEEQLAKYSGDIIAHQAVKICKGIKNYTQYAGSSLEAMITEYLQEESDLLPTALEIDHFSNSVDELRLATDRLQAHINARIYNHARD